VVAVDFDPAVLTVVAAFADPPELDPLDVADSPLEAANGVEPVVAVPDADGTAVVEVAVPAVVDSPTLVDVVELPVLWLGPEAVVFFELPPHAAATIATTAAATHAERHLPPAISDPPNG
jgi:hypothetical protein